MPPWNSLVDLPDVPDAKSCCSTRATFRPLEARSRAVPQPVTPPPTTRTSKGLPAARDLRCSARVQPLEDEDMLLG